MIKAPTALLVSCALAGCAAQQIASLKDAAPDPLTRTLRSDDLGFIKAAKAHAIKNGKADWQNPATGSHGSVTTGKAVQVGKSWCFPVTVTTYAGGTGTKQTSEHCNPPLPSPGKA